MPKAEDGAIILQNVASWNKPKSELKCLSWINILGKPKREEQVHIDSL